MSVYQNKKHETVLNERKKAKKFKKRKKERNKENVQHN